MEVLRSESSQVKSALDSAQDVQVSGTNKNIIEFLQELPTSRPLLIAEKLVISNPNGVMPDQANAPILSVDMRIGAKRLELVGKIK